MDRIIFLNGAFVRFEDAQISIMDRGFLFADGIYEVSAVLDGGLVDNDAHLARLARSLNEIGVPNPYTSEEWTRHQFELVRRNQLEQGIVYIQVTRGLAERDFAVPVGITPTVVMFTQPKSILSAPLQTKGATVVTRPDLRWARRDIKSIGLLAQVLAKRQAAEAGAMEVFMVQDGTVTEGGSSTAFIITRDGRIVTRQLSTAILPGITRGAVMGLAAAEGLVLEERAFTVLEAREAAEVFFTSASNFVVPVVSLDGQPVGTGLPGTHTTKLMRLYIEMARTQAAASKRDAAARG